MLCIYCTASASLFKESDVCFQMLSVSAVFSGVLLCLLKSLLMWEFLWNVSRRLELLGNVLSRPSARQCFLLKQKLHKSKCPVQWIFTSTRVFGSQYRNGIRSRWLVSLSVSVQPCSPRVNCLLTSLVYSIVDLTLHGFEPHINGIMQCAVSELLVQPVCGGHVAAVCPSTAVWHDSVLQLTSSVADRLRFVFSFLLSQRKFTWISEIYALNFFLSAFSILWVLLCSSSWVWSVNHPG